MIKEEYVSFETAKLAKEKGFDEPCKLAFDNEKCSTEIFASLCNSYDVFPKDYYSRPTQSLLAKWLRKKYNIHVLPKPIFDSELGLQEYGCDVHFPTGNGLVFSDKPNISNVSKKWEENLYTLELGNYEDAMEEGLIYALNKLPNMKRND